MKLSSYILLPMLLVLLPPSFVAWADVFVLRNGGQVTGVLVERGQDQQYLVRTDEGAVVTLTRDQVLKVKEIDDVLLEYRERSRTMPDTVDAHRQLAEWCKRHHLSRQREHHQRRILQLDPNDEQARESLGYQKHRGRWLTRDEIMKARGLRFFDGAYRTDQEIALRKRQKKREQAEADWLGNIKTWRRWLDSRRQEEALHNIRSIDDPHAAPALVQLLDKEKNRRIRELYVSTLGELRHPVAVEKLVELSLFDLELGMRESCLDLLLRNHQPLSLTPFVKALKNRENVVVLHAAEALRRIGDPAAISPLIDALITTHKVDNPNAAPGQINAAFQPNGGGAGFAFGGNQKVFRIEVQNRAVRMALLELTGGQDFQFNEQAWRRWFVNQQMQEHVDARRDE